VTHASINQPCVDRRTLALNGTFDQQIVCPRILGVEGMAHGNRHVRLLRLVGIVEEQLVAVEILDH
jgi:hypothetical protein